MSSALETAFLSSGIPSSRQRLLVVRVLAESPDHPTAAVLHARARKIDLALGRTTVNRALAALVEAGLAHIIETPGRQYRYEDATPGQHGHVIDQQTGKLINIEAPELDRTLTEVAHALGYRLQGFRLLLTGQRAATDDLVTRASPYAEPRTHEQKSSQRSALRSGYHDVRR